MTDTPTKDMFDWLWTVEGHRSIFGNKAIREAARMNQLIEDRDVESFREVRANFSALAVEYDNPWLEVFGRHWELQARLVLTDEGATAVPDAVAAFELGHREENVECPQSVCTTQDLCMAFSATDDEGYADQVIEACDETLARIDKTWPCYTCVLTEKARGLSASKRHEEAAEIFVELEGLFEATEDKVGLAWRGVIHELLRLGRAEEAAAVATRSSLSEVQPEHEHERWRLLGAQGCAWVAVGKIDDGVAAFDGLPDPVEERSIEFVWRQLLDDLLDADAIAWEQDDHERKMQLAATALEVSAYRVAFNRAASAALQAARAGKAELALEARQYAVNLQQHLIAPGSAPTKLDEIDAALNETCAG